MKKDKLTKKEKDSLTKQLEELEEAIESNENSQFPDRHLNGFARGISFLFRSMYDLPKKDKDKDEDKDNN